MTSIFLDLWFITLIPLDNFKSLAGILRGPGGRGPWPNPNNNSVSHSLSRLLFAMIGCLYKSWASFFLSSLMSALTTDSLFILIARKLCGKCSVMGSCVTTGHKLPATQYCLSLDTHPSSHHFRAPQGEVGHQELQSCPVLEVSASFFYFI